MRTESVQSFAKKQLLRHYQTLDDFIQTWTEAERKQAIMDELKEYAILIDAVREANPALKDADIFDVICHVAFDQPPLTRKERANNVKKRNYFGKYEGKKLVKYWRLFLTNMQRMVFSTLKRRTSWRYRHSIA